MDTRFLTSEEATLLSQAAEHWLRLGDVELNPGEHVLKLLRNAAVRPKACPREDIASLNWTLELALPDDPAPQELTLVCPGDADLSLARVSVLTLLGLNFVGRVVGSVAPLQLGGGPPKVVKLLAARRCTALTARRGPAFRAG
jgi:hypothetical protein